MDAKNIDPLLSELISKLIYTESLVLAQHATFMNYLKSIGHEEMIAAYRNDRAENFRNCMREIISRFHNLPETLKVQLIDNMERAIAEKN